MRLREGLGEGLGSYYRAGVVKGRKVGWLRGALIRGSRDQVMGTWVVFLHVGIQYMYHCFVNSTEKLCLSNPDSCISSCQTFET